MSNKELELKIKYNAIIKKQEEAFTWFESEDFKKKFELQGGAFFDKCALRYKYFEDMRIKTLNDLEELGVKTTTNNIIYGFTVKENK